MIGTADLIVREIKRLNGVVTSFLTYARQPDLKLQRADPNVAVRQAVQLLERGKQEKEAEHVALTDIRACNEVTSTTDVSCVCVLRSRIIFHTQDQCSLSPCVLISSPSSRL